MPNPFSDVDFQLLKKYDRPGPRYTSYPTAPLFSPAFTAEDFNREVIKTNKSGSTSDISLYFHFPFCDTLCYFCGCTMLVTRDRSRIAEYIQYLKKEIDLVARLIASHRKVTQIHWGGGTPTHLAPEEILDIAGYIKRSFQIDPEVEMSVEIDPRELTQKHLGTLRHVGFNRVSFGVQDFNPKVQEAVNRIQPEMLTLNALTWATALDFESINVDLMYGLPFQTVLSFKETLCKVVEFNPDRVAVFNYAHVPWLKSHQRLIHPEDLPSADQKLSILETTIEALSSAGYEYIGMDHFAKPNDELTRAQKQKTLYRNFQGYSTRANTDLYGLGMSAISQFHDIYAQNTKSLPEYYAALDQGKFATHLGYRMSEDDQIRKYTITRLMCDLEINKASIEERFNIDFDEYFDSSFEMLQELVADGLVVLSLDKIAVTNVGRLLLRNIAMCFDAYIGRIKSSNPVFSRTV